MLARLALRSKLLLVGAIPLLVLMVFAGVALRDAYASTVQADDDAALFRPFRALTLLAQASADERIGAAWYEHIPDDGPPASDALMLNTRDAMDVAVDRLEAAVPALSDRAGAEAQQAVRSLLLDLNGLSAARARVNLHEDPGGVYQEVSESAMSAAELLLHDFRDPDLSSGSRAVLDLARGQLALGNEARVVIDHLAGSTTPELATWVAAVTDQRAQRSRFSDDATAAQRAAFAATAASAPGGDPVRGDSPEALPTRMPTPGEVDPEVYADWYTRRQGGLAQGTSAVVDAVDAAFGDARSSTRSFALELAAGAAVAILLVIGLSYVVARSVTRPIRALTRGARDMAERRLPQLVDTLRRGGELTSDQLEGFTPIRVASRDELGELATAFNTVQQVTLAVADEQSRLLRKGIGDLYVNLARRNQSLLDRQLGLLDDIEARVEDPDQLGSLFELDHLATRMRRNAESLLVLAGSEQPRVWRDVVPMIDVVRGAAAEIADFARVSYFGFDDDVAVSGNAVADVSHLLAELLENAAAFSPPTAPVVVAGHRMDRRFVITIADEGIGMDEPRLAAANALLAHPPAPGLALSRTLGLYVVAHLAKRHGIRVQLRPSPGTGLTAVVGLPTNLLARLDEGGPSEPSPAAAPRPSPSRSGRRAAGAPTPHSAHPPALPAPVRRAPETPPVFVAEPVDDWPPVTAPVTAPVAATGGRDQLAEEPALAPSLAWRSDDSGDALLQRGGAAPAGNGSRAGHADDGDAALPSRTPGANLSEAPDVRASGASGASRPRPERVAELLARHERGKSEGRSRRSGDGT